MNTLPLHQTDGYKVDHRSQYPEGTELVFSNFTPRSTQYMHKVDGITDEKIVVFGLQYFVRWFVCEEFKKNFFKQPKKRVIQKYVRRINGYLGEGKVNFEHVEALHDLGYLPIAIYGLPEGTVTKAKIPHVVIENTVPGFFWLTNYFETVMSCMLWKPATSATTARNYRKILEHYCRETGGDLGFVKFQGHDFSFRGMSGLQDAQMSGAGHLLSFVGTDTIPAIDFLEDYYYANCEKELVGCSVPATEHSVMCMGSKENEIDTFKRLINDIYPNGIVSIVSDTWNYWRVISEFLVDLKEDILKRDGKTTIRPDSGCPVEVITGKSITLSEFHSAKDLQKAYNAGFKYIRIKNDYHEIIEGSLQEYGYVKLKEAFPVWSLSVQEYAEMEGSIQAMWDIFGGTINEKEFKVLDSHIGLIYGDSITLQRAKDILERLKLKGFCSTNVVLGIGSYTYEYCTRDTLGWAMKATAGVVKSEFREIYKDPKTDNGTKKSARGWLAVFKDEDGEYILEDQTTRERFENCEFRLVYKNGCFCSYPYETLEIIRKRIEQTL